jgi:hypothetical protein
MQTRPLGLRQSITTLLYVQGGDTLVRYPSGDTTINRPPTGSLLPNLRTKQSGLAMKKSIPWTSKYLIPDIRLQSLQRHRSALSSGGAWDRHPCHAAWWRYRTPCMLYCSYVLSCQTMSRMDCESLHYTASHRSRRCRVRILGAGGSGRDLLR